MSKNINDIDLLNIIDKLKNMLDNAKKCTKNSDVIDSKRKLINNMRKTATFRRLIILTPRNFEWLGYSNSRELINSVDEVVSIGSIAASILISIAIWFMIFPLSPINLPSYVTDYKFSWKLSSLAFISLTSSMMYFIISSIKQAIISIKTLRKLADDEEKNLKSDEIYYSSYAKLVEYIEYFIKIASKYSRLNDTQCESVQLVAKASKICLDFFDARDKSIVLSEIEEIKCQIDTIETDIDSLEKYKLDSEKMSMLGMLTRGAEESLENTGIYRERLRVIIDKTKDLIKIHSKSEGDIVRNIVNIVIPELIDLCCSSNNENENVAEALSITESKIDLLLSTSEKVFNIKAKSTVSAIKQMLK